MRLNRLELSRTRLIEATVLLDAGSPSGAYYLAGYAVECGLKACIAKDTAQFDFPDRKRAVDSYVHDLIRLAETAGLTQKIDDFDAKNERFAGRWSLVKSWSESSRYEFWTDIQAKSMVDAVSDASSGVMAWLIQHW